MGILIGNANSNSAISGTTLTVSITITGNYITASIGYATAATVGTVTATCNGVAMTSVSRMTVGTQNAIETFELYNPTSGNVVFTVSKTIIVAYGIVQEYGNVGSRGTVATGSNTAGTSSTLAISTVDNTNIAYAFLYHTASEGHTPLDGQTEIADITVPTGNAAVAGYKTSPTASQNERWSWTTSTNWLTHGFALVPISGNNFQSAMLLGV